MEVNPVRSVGVPPAAGRLNAWRSRATNLHHQAGRRGSRDRGILRLLDADRCGQGRFHLRAGGTATLAARTARKQNGTADQGRMGYAASAGADVPRTGPGGGLPAGEFPRSSQLSLQLPGFLLLGPSGGRRPSSARQRSARRARPASRCSGGCRPLRTWSSAPPARSYIRSICGYSPVSPAATETPNRPTGNFHASTASRAAAPRAHLVTRFRGVFCLTTWMKPEARPCRRPMCSPVRVDTCPRWWLCTRVAGPRCCAG